MQVHGALRRAGRSRRIQPEAGVVAGGLGRRERRRRRCHQAGKRTVGGRRRFVGRAGHDHVRKVRVLAQQGRKRRQQRRRDDQRAGAAVAQHVVVVVRREQRVRRDRHDARLDRTKERGWKVDRVEVAEQHALLGREAERRERVRAAVDALAELAVGVRAGVVDVRDLAGAAGNQIALDQVVRGIVVARNLDPRRTRAMIGRAQGRHAGLLPVAKRGHATVGLQRAADRGKPSASCCDYGRHDASAHGPRKLRQFRA